MHFYCLFKFYSATTQEAASLFLNESIRVASWPFITPPSSLLPALTSELSPICFFFLVCWGKCPRHQLHFKVPEFSHISLCSKIAVFGKLWVKRRRGWAGLAFTCNNNRSSNFIYQFKQIRGTAAGQNCLGGVTPICIMHWVIQIMD